MPPKRPAETRSPNVPFRDAARRASGSKPTKNAKNAALEPHRARHDGSVLTTDHGLPIPHTDDSLRAGLRGPSLLEDFHLREKITRFDHERIPERVVHARGSAAHGFFQLYAPQAKLTKARFLNDTATKTPVFVRFSTVGGSRGSADTVRDVRGFAVKFYTDEGNFDLVGNNMPVFFIQDGIKFPDIVHAVKPEPHNEMPQASSAHDSFWDFVSLVPETAHMVMWLMSDRAIPRSYRMMEGFGVHTFRLIDERGGTRLVKFHWKPLLGMHSLVWEEAQKLSGCDPDYHRRDLWDAIESGAFPEYELGVQVMDERQQTSMGFDLLDPTKLVPEELVPVIPIGKLTLDRNPDNFFAETEQVAFCVANLVPGIDVTDDPLMQARLFSYQDTQLTRLGGPNFAELPINRPVVPVHNHQQDGFGRQTILASRANYHPNSLSGGCPFLASPKDGFRSFAEPLEGPKVRARSESFGDHFSQATMFVESLTPIERKHLVDACRFEVGKVERKEIRERVVNQIFARINPALAQDVAVGVGVRFEPPKASAKRSSKRPIVSPALSIELQKKGSVATRKIAILAADGVSASELVSTRAVLEKKGAVIELIAPTQSAIKADDGTEIAPDKSLLNAPSVAYDAVYVPGGKKSVAALAAAPGDRARLFVAEAYRHHKAIGATGDGVDFVRGSVSGDAKTDSGLVLEPRNDRASKFAATFAAAIAAHRHWDRPGAGR